VGHLKQRRDRGERFEMSRGGRTKKFATGASEFKKPGKRVESFYSVRLRLFIG